MQSLPFFLLRSRPHMGEGLRSKIKKVSGAAEQEQCCSCSTSQRGRLLCGSSGAGERSNGAPILVNFNRLKAKVLNYSVISSLLTFT